MLLSPTKFCFVHKKSFFPPILRPVPTPVPVPIPIPIPVPRPPRVYRKCIISRVFNDVVQSDYSPFFNAGAMIVLYIAVMYYITQMQKKNIGDFLKNIGKHADLEQSTLSFSDIAGIENAKDDLMDVIDFLKNKENYVKMGARIPKGILLVGPPGTGKTLLSKAVAGEANVPFISCSGSEFIELYVGTGAARIRELFKKAKEKKPCIIFIDEIDAIGKKRATSPNTSNDEKDQTLNQLLTEMDGFEENKGIIIMGATNRVELLDDALLRPGRFDRKIHVELPNLNARKDILSLYFKNKPIATNVDIQKLAKLTIGFSGAELENLCNETAIYAVRNKKEELTQDLFEHIYDKLTLGPESRNNRITEAKQKVLAYHEAGHVLAGILLGEFDTFRKVSIAPRGDAGGITFFEPSEDRDDLGLYSREYLHNQIIVLLAGRAAEQITFGTKNITTGASSDIERATQLAIQMVAKFGFNETIGPINAYETNLYDKDVASEVQYLIENAYNQACDLLRKYESYLIKLSTLLIEKETINSDEILSILQGLECNID